MLIYKLLKSDPNRFIIVDEDIAISILDSAILQNELDFKIAYLSNSYDEVIFITNNIIESKLEKAILIKQNEHWYSNINNVYDIINQYDED